MCVSCMRLEQLQVVGQWEPPVDIYAVVVIH